MGEWFKANKVKISRTIDLNSSRSSNSFRTALATDLPLMIHDSLLCDIYKCTSAQCYGPSTCTSTSTPSARILHLILNLILITPESAVLSISHSRQTLCPSSLLFFSPVHLLLTLLTSFCPNFALFSGKPAERPALLGEPNCKSCFFSSFQRRPGK